MHFLRVLFYIIMNFESLLPFFVILGVFLFAFFLEAIVVYAFKIKTFWKALGITIVVNLVSLLLIYFLAAAFLSKLGYEIGQFNGLNLQPQVIAFMWWFSSIAEGLLLQFFTGKHERKKAFTAAIIMNAISYLFLYFFITNSH